MEERERPQDLEAMSHDELPEEFVRLWPAPERGATLDGAGDTPARPHARHTAARLIRNHDFVVQYRREAGGTDHFA